MIRTLTLTLGLFIGAGLAVWAHPQEPGHRAPADTTCPPERPLPPGVNADRALELGGEVVIHYPEVQP